MNEYLNAPNGFHEEIDKMSDYYNKFGIILRKNFDET